MNASLKLFIKAFLADFITVLLEVLTIFILSYCLTYCWDVFMPYQKFDIVSHIGITGFFWVLKFIWHIDFKEDKDHE